MTNEKKAELWDYYQEFVRVHGAECITDLVVQRDNLDAQVNKICNLAFECCDLDMMNDLEQGIANIKHKYPSSTKADKG